MRFKFSLLIAALVLSAASLKAVDISPDTVVVVERTWEACDLRLTPAVSVYPLGNARTPQCEPHWRMSAFVAANMKEALEHANGNGSLIGKPDGEPYANPIPGPTGSVPIYSGTTEIVGFFHLGEKLSIRLKVTKHSKPRHVEAEEWTTSAWEVTR